MRGSFTIVLATVAGLAGFGWTLFSYEPGDEPFKPTASSEQQAATRSARPWRVSSDPAERVRTLRQYLQDHPEDTDAWHSLGWNLRRTGDEPGATDAWKTAAGLQERNIPGDPDPGYFYNLACFRAMAGDHEGALTAWADAVAAGWGDADHASRDRDLDPIRDDPRFAETFKEIVPSANRTTRVRAG
jgi:hypothetical protein